jgi:hypothetical protein
MDVFGTVVTSGQIIYSFLSACSAYSEDAKSLASRFQWDLRVIEHVIDYFSKRPTGKNGKLSMEDQKLLDETAEYLTALSAKVVASSGKIQAKGWLGKSMNRVLWIARQKDLYDLEREIYEWTNRFDVRLLGLPPQLMTVIPQLQEGDAPKLLRSAARIREFQELSAKAQGELAQKLFLNPIPAQLQQVPGPYREITFDGQPVLLESRHYDSREEPKRIAQLKSDIGVLAATFNCLDTNSGVNLLRTRSYFQQDSGGRFVLVQELPYSVTGILTLQDLISATGPNGVRLPAMHPLNNRFEFARRLATTLLFLHTTGFVHKNISSKTVFVIEPEGSDKAARFPHVLSQPYLLGFAAVRSKEGWSDALVPSASDWSQDIYQHPDRLKEGSSARFITTYDVYSFGVVLLEVGLWRPLQRYEKQLNGPNVEERRKALLKICKDLDATMGRGYRDVVQWCLELTGQEVVREVTFASKALDKLELLAEAVS